ncbi:unnamed protein product [Adineta ricciae]|uniref:PLAT domain-containing protein n=1 Tax=Adineta ricciae TaxID=249248 RepID=A0A815RJS1_ADIRI|nr:unnamed protein product [Adineta ricciae]
MNISFCLLWIFIQRISTLSFNQPKFCSNASWNKSAITFADQNIIGSFPYALFVNTNNTIYSFNIDTKRILIWTNQSSNPTKTISGNFTYSYSIFVTNVGDIFIDNGQSNNQVNQWIQRNESLITVMSVDSQCYGLFVDQNNSLYCSMYNQHKVIKRWLNDADLTPKIVAGNGTEGSALNELSSPVGIFVDVNFDLYVADYRNNRIQQFEVGQLNGKTRVGQGSSNFTITLSLPIGIVLDAQKYLFILEQGSGRIMGEDANGFRCLVGCDGGGSQSHQLSAPCALSFDIDGNLFVIDNGNKRIQKFNFEKTSCNKSSVIGTTNQVAESELSTVSLTTTKIEETFPMTTEGFLSTVRTNSDQTAFPRISQALSFNQPKFCLGAVWNGHGITFANQSIVGQNPLLLFIDTNNTIYVVDQDKNEILIWFNQSTYPTKTISGSFSYPTSMFVTTLGDIIIDNGFANKRVDQWISKNNTFITVMDVESKCTGLFVDQMENLYCSMTENHKIVKKSLNQELLTPIVVAGTSSSGSASNELSEPHGIFVDTSFNLYVADYANNRIQLFEFGNSNGITKAGRGSATYTLELNRPISIVLDNDKYLFISDQQKSRIIGSNQVGFQCIIGCDERGSQSDQLSYPYSLSFDIDGNIFVADEYNSRIQKFLFEKDSCQNEVTTIDQQSEITSHQVLSTTNPSKNECETPHIRLIPTSTYLSPIQIRRNQNFYILSKVKLNCSKSFQVKSQWKIQNCTTECNTNELLFDSIDSTAYDLHIPSTTLPYGIYRFTLQIQMIVDSAIQSSKSVYIQVISTGITANLVPLGTSMITSGYEQDLHLNPGKYSNDPDGYPFNSTDWTYLYDCRAYNTYDIVDRYSINNPSELSCLSNQFQYEFDGVELPKETSVTIFAGSLELDETYTFSVRLTNRRNRTIHAFGSVLVQIKDSQRPMISIGCVVPTLCPLNLGYRLINPTMQLALFSRCESNCQPIENIKWNIFYKSMNSPSSTIQWSSFEESDLYAKIYIFGANTTNVTITNHLFSTYRHVKYWRFEVTYTFRSQIGSSALDFEIQMEFVNPTCSIFPTNGTTTTRFHITCYHPSKLNFIQEYSLYYWLNDSMKLTIIAFSPVSNFTVQLPSGKLNLVLQIRDLNYQTTKLNLTTIEIFSDLSLFYENNQSVLQILHTKDQNFIAQIISSLSQQLNGMTDETLRKSIQDGIQPTRIFVSSLGQQRLVSENFVSSINESTMKEVNEQLQSQAELREYLSEFITDLTLSIENMKMQLSTLIQLTETTNQLTRQTLTIVSQKCHQLAKDLHSLLIKIPYEDVQMVGQQLLQCAANMLTGVNGVLQERSNLLKSDFQRSTKIPDDYDTNLDSDWSNLKLFVDGNDLSMEKINENRNRFYQEKLARQISKRADEIISLVTSSFNIHLNIGQKMIIDTPETFVSFEVISIEQVGRAEIHLSSNVTSSLENISPVCLVRSMIERLAVFDKNSKTNLSTMIFNSTHHNQTFHYHFVNITSSLPISVHLEFESVNVNLSHLFIYKFDQFPRLNQLDGWKLFCSSIRNSPLFLDNQQTIGHQTLIFSLRELTSSESNEFCSNETLPIPTDPVHFTSDYQTRVHISDYYYLDEQNRWKSDGLTVRSKINHYETECFSTHLTKFASGFVILSEMTDWNYVFNNANFHKNKTVYLTIITVTLIYIILMIYARKCDKKDFEKLGVTPLSDNRSSDSYFYQLIVFTGHRKDSGTKSKVHFVLYGENEVTRIRTFDDPQREIFQR